MTHSPTNSLYTKHPILHVCVCLLAFACSRPATSQQLTLLESFTEPLHSVDVAVGTGGRVEKIYIREGDEVMQGKLLLSLESNDLHASLAVAQADAKATAKLEALRVQHELRRHRRQQFERLHQSGTGSLEELKRANAEDAIAYFNVKQAEEEVNRNLLRVEEIQAQILSRQVFSPIDGHVTSIRKKTGEYVSLNEPDVATLVDLSQLRANFYVPGSLAQSISKDDYLPVKIHPNNVVVRARVEHIGVVTEAESGLVKVKLLIDNSQKQIRSGVRCQLRLTSN